MKLSGITLAIGLIISAALIAGGMVGSSYLQQMNTQATKNQAIDGCFMAAKGMDTTGSIEKNGWSVDKSNINTEVYNDCMKKKGY